MIIQVSAPSKTFKPVETTTGTSFLRKVIKVKTCVIIVNVIRHRCAIINTNWAPSVAAVTAGSRLLSVMLAVRNPFAPAVLKSRFAYKQHITARPSVKAQERTLLIPTCQT